MDVNSCQLARLAAWLAMVPWPKCWRRCWREARTALIAEELRKMGEFIMLTLVEQAQGEEVEADSAVCQGRFRDELLRYLEETRPAMLVLGSPKPDTAYLDSGSLDRLTQEIEEQTGVLVKLV